MNAETLRGDWDRRVARNPVDDIPAVRDGAIWLGAGDDNRRWRRRVGP